LISDAEPDGYRRSKALYQDIARGSQTMGNLPVVCLAEVEHDALLSTVPHLKCRLSSCRIALRWLDFDYLSAIVGKYHGR
jgi:hypothetical protein